MKHRNCLTMTPMKRLMTKWLGNHKIYEGEAKLFDSFDKICVNLSTTYDYAHTSSVNGLLTQ